MSEPASVAASFPSPAEPRVCERFDLLVGIAVGLAGFVLYWQTTAPSVTLLDSGEFVLAAQRFGVPHPTGYPLWTMLAWLFTLPPIGNPAWQVALFSGFAGAIAVGLCGALLSSMTRWIFPGFGRVAPAVLVAAWALLFAVSESMWSQAVIAEVYTLHALIVGAYLASLYVWVRNPQSDRPLLWAVFFLALGFSNHHLILALAPLPVLALLLLRRDLLPDFLAAGLLTAAIGYLLFALLSGENATLKTALRFTWLALTGFAVFCVWRKFVLHWEFVAYLPFVVAAGLLPYAYMPLASSTNPPMNWGYTSEKEGFFFSINRSQYGGSLDEQLLRTVGRMVGTSSLRPAHAVDESLPVEPWDVGAAQQIQRWSGFFWLRLWGNFGLLAIPSFVAALFLIRSQLLAQRTWLYLIITGFFLAAFLQPLFDGAQIDRAGWWTQMPYHTYTMFFFALVGALGSGILLRWARATSHLVEKILLCMLMLSPFWVAWRNYDLCSQRDRWFGWKFGFEMLRDLPRNAFVFGGTDPGRFVPTYMILGESTAAPNRKIDPTFDRRDLFIVTQNAMTDPFYLKYIRDHYTESRPPVRNAFERWLGRAGQYPDALIELPSEDEVREVIAEGLKSGTDPMDINSEVAKIIWERNKDKYPFYVEESFPLKWSYDHAAPHGLIYQIHPEPLENIPDEAVRRDMEFWEKTMNDLLSNPRFHGDYDARRSFSALRQSLANLYLHREMNAEAEIAMRQALELLPGNGISLLQLSRMLWDDSRYEEAIEIWDRAVAFDPNNLRYAYLRAVALSRPEWEREIRALRAKVQENPADEKTWRDLITVLLHIAEEEKADEEIAAALEQFADNEEFLRHLLAIEINRRKTESAREIANRILLLAPQDMTLRLLLASLALQREDTAEFYIHAREAVNVGGAKAREILQRDAAFRSIRNEDQFKEIVREPLP